jgi:hypothetical protein
MLGAKLFHDPSDIAVDALPGWVRSQLAAATAQDPMIALYGNLFNFSPVLPNPFVPHFPRLVMEALVRGVKSIYWVESERQSSGLHLNPSDLVFVQAGPATGSQAVVLNGLVTGLSSKYDLFLATFAVQSGCRRLVIHPSASLPAFVEKYRRSLESSLDEISLNGASSRGTM